MEQAKHHSRVHSRLRAGRGDLSLSMGYLSTYSSLVFSDGFFPQEHTESWKPKWEMGGRIPELPEP